MEADVVVIGAGLAGLVCAVRLHEAGRDVLVLEAQDDVGGRVRTDSVDGYRLDRGFQVLLTAYPAVRRWFDLDALELHPFSPGVLLQERGRSRRLVDPFQEPLAAVRSLRCPALSPADAVRLLLWRRELLATPGPRLAARAPVPTAALLRRRGFSPALVERFFRPFLSGVFFDPELTTSSRMTELVFRSFFRGDVALPAGGMARLPQQLADRLPDDRVVTGARVRRVRGGDGTRIEVDVEDADPVRAERLVVAVDAPTATALLAGSFLDEPPPGRAATTLYYRTERSPVGGPHLVLGSADPGGGSGGPVTTLAVPTDVAPGYAPRGAGALVSVSLVGLPDEGDAEVDAAVRRQLTAWFGPSVAAWELLAVYRIAYAQPRQDVGDLTSLARDVRVGPRTWICGDHRDTGSIQGALVSGRRAADAVLLDAS